MRSERRGGSAAGGPVEGEFGDGVVSGAGSNCSGSSGSGGDRGALVGKNKWGC